MKRTDLDDLLPVEVLFFFWAALKSEARDGSLGVTRVAEDDDEALAEWSNCAVSSASWVRRRGSCDVMDLKAEMCWHMEAHMVWIQPRGVGGWVCLLV